MPEKTLRIYFLFFQTFTDVFSSCSAYRTYFSSCVSKKTFRILFYYLLTFTDVFSSHSVFRTVQKKPPGFLPAPLFFLKSDGEAIISVFLPPFQYQPVLKGISLCFFRDTAKLKKITRIFSFPFYSEIPIYMCILSSHYICFVPSSLSPAPQGTVFKNLNCTDIDIIFS